MTELRLLETVHPTRDGMKDFEALFGIEDLKEALTDELALILDRRRLEAWGQRHHADGLAGRTCCSRLPHCAAGA